MELNIAGLVRLLIFRPYFMSSFSFMYDNYTYLESLLEIVFTKKSNNKSYTKDATVIMIFL